MLIIQEHSVNEHNIGRQAIRFAVSNIYSELFLTNALAPAGTIYTDIYDFEKHKQDLELEDGKFGIDELTFEINSLSCKSETDKQAMYFCLDATNVNAVRYCALFFGEEPTSENMLFVGKLNTKISGEDIAWRGVNFSPNIRPERSYKLTAYTFDVSMLDECEINDDVYNLESIRINNLRERFFDETLFNTWFKMNASHRVAYQEWGATNRYIHYSPTINLKTYLDKMLELSSDLLQEKHDISISFTLAESDLGIDVLPSYISERATTPINSHMLTFSKENYLPFERRIRLKLSDAKTSTTSPVLISQTMIDSRLGNDYKVGEDGVIDFVSVKSETMDMSFMTKLKTMSELLFTLARDFGCFLILGYESVGEISIEFVPRESIVKAGYTYLVDVEESSFDSSSNRDSDGGTNFYALATSKLDEGKDVSWVVTHLGVARRNNSEAYLSKVDEIQELKEQKNIDSKKLMLSISPTLDLWGDSNKNADYVPLNTVARGESSHIGWSYETDFEPMYDNGSTKVNLPKQLHTGIYIQTEGIETTTPPQPTLVTRTAHAIIATINGVDKVFYKLADYINEIYKTGQQFYETALNIKVPYWNGFNDSESATGASWKKLTLGSVFQFSEIVKRFADDVFIDIGVDRDYVVVGIERDLSNPETTIKLIDKSAYAFGYPETIPELIPLPQAGPVNENDTITNTDSGKSGYLIATTDPVTEIEIGEAVMILSDNTIAKAEANSLYPGADLGIALASGISGDTIMVQTGGRVNMPGVYDFTGYVEKNLFLRTNASGTNLSHSPLLAITGSEDVYCILGRIDSLTSFVLRPKKWKFV
ncbi:MAG: E3 UFM1-protein ligase 1 [Candidatus Kapabacteria bacterium]|nr:E3 UFM1-protein ligase 1 [Candidatus Kapabacteria bacterium]